MNFGNMLIEQFIKTRGFLRILDAANKVVKQY